MTATGLTYLGTHTTIDQPMTMVASIRLRMRGWLYHRLYHELARGYDAVSWMVSLGQGQPVLRVRVACRSSWKRKSPRQCGGRWKGRWVGDGWLALGTKKAPGIGVDTWGLGQASRGGKGDADRSGCAVEKHPWWFTLGVLSSYLQGSQKFALPANATHV